MAQTKVITQLFQKQDSAFDTTNPYFLGAEQRFVGSLLNSHVNNLEEQLLLGVDNVTTKWTEDGVTYTSKMFIDNERNFSGDSFYLLYTEDYSSNTSEYYGHFDDSNEDSPSLVVSSSREIKGKPGEILIAGEDGDGSYVFNDSYVNATFEELNPGYSINLEPIGDVGMTFDDDGNLVVNPDGLIARRDILYFRKKGDAEQISTSYLPIDGDVQIAEKITYYVQNSDPNDKKLVTREIITNKI